MHGFQYFMAVLEEVNPLQCFTSTFSESFSGHDHPAFLRLLLHNAMGSTILYEFLHYMSQIKEGCYTQTSPLAHF